MLQNTKHIPSINRQRGAVLLALMLVLLAGSSYLLLKEFNANSIQLDSTTNTSKALKKAKEVLLSYAVSYPDLGNNGGPGYLPCPDISNDGHAVGNCSYSGGTTIGYFPYRTLDTEELRDGNGQRLWYVISERYRYGASKTVPMNSDIPDDTVNNLDLNIDNGFNSIDDIVAIVIAPGSPYDSQDRTSNASDAVNLDPDNFMEGENADLDQVYTSVQTNSRNDKLILITRDELLSAVENRVMGDVVKSLQQYHDNYNALPWLSPYTDPEVSDYHSEVGSNGYQGHIPFHWSGDTPGTTNRNPFTSNLNIAWQNIQNASITDNPDNSGNIAFPMPTTACVINSECNHSDDPFNGLVTNNNDVVNATCVWSNRSTFDCEGEFSVNDDNVLIYTDPIPIYGYKFNYGRGWVNFYTDTSGSYRWEIGYIYEYGIGWGNWSVRPVMQGDINRLYDFDMTYEDQDFNESVDIDAPDATNSRTRNIEISNEEIDAGDVNIVVTDTMNDITYYPDFENEPDTKTASRSLTSDNDTTGSIAGTNIKYDIDLDAGELPGWFVENKWHELIYIAYSRGEPYPGNTLLTDPCSDPSVTCLNSDYVTPYNSANLGNIRALVLMAGRELAGQDRSTGSLSQYLENENVDGNIYNYTMNTVDSNINDYIRILLEN